MTKPTWYDDVKAIFDRAGVPEYIWVPIMLKESGGAPDATNERYPDRSYGLFQLNTIGQGQGVGHPVNELLDPVKNASIAVVEIAKAFQQYGNNLAMVSIASRHPGLVPTSDPRILATLALQRDYLAGTGFAGAWRAFTSMLPPVKPGTGSGGGSGGAGDTDANLSNTDMPHLFPEWNVPFFGIGIGRILDHTLFYGVFIAGGMLFVGLGVYGLVATRIKSNETIRNIKEIAGTAAKVAA